MPDADDKLQEARGATTWRAYLLALGMVALCCIFGAVGKSLGLTETNIVMIFLAGFALVAAWLGHGPAITAAVVGVLAFDYFFVAPVFAFAPSDTQYFVTLTVMLGISLLICELMDRVHTQLRISQRQRQHTAELLQASQQQERRTAQLYDLSRQLSKVADVNMLIRISGWELNRAFCGAVILYLRDPAGALQLRYCEDSSLAADASVRAMAQWVADNHCAAGLGTDVFRETPALLVPMVGTEWMVGVLGVLPEDTKRFSDPGERRMLETAAQLIAFCIQRAHSQIEVQEAQIQVQSEQLRNSLLSSVSHDLRTPLAMIGVTAASLLEGSIEENWPAKQQMLQTMVDESERLSRQVDNLLDMARFDSGTLVLNRDWHVFEELVGVALARLRRELGSRRVKVQIPSDLPLLWVADDLIEQVLVNLLENAARYTPAGSQIEITASYDLQLVRICIADNGPGLPPGSEAKVFEKFFRGRSVVADGQRGVGLGLTICQAIIRAHGGEIIAANRPEGGAEFVVSLHCPRQMSPATMDEILDCTVS